jgi:hypothetical protein
VDELYCSIQSYINGERSNTFGDLMLGLFERQYRLSLPYRRLCDSIGAAPTTIGHWNDIPAVPAQAFRQFDLTCRPISQCVSVFWSSGTTSERSSRHWMDREALELYDLNLSRYFDSKFAPIGHLLAVMPSADKAPHSSLSHMLSVLRAERFADEDLAIFAGQLDELISLNEPITLFGTAFGLAELLSIRRHGLPAGSRVIETGGFKGRRSEMPRNEFYRLIREALLLDDSACFSEYGMCELSSQFYSKGENGAFAGPPWIRTRCIDPLTNTDGDVGSPGILRQYDLANWNSVCVVQTQDRGVIDSEGGIRLLGRATDAELRGCSLTAEELWSK